MRRMQTFTHMQLASGRCFKFKDVIMGVELNYDEDGDKFSMDVEDRKELHNFIQVENNKRIHQKKKRGERSQAVCANNVGIDDE